MVIAITIILCFITTTIVILLRTLYESETSTNNNNNKIKLDNNSSVMIRSVSGCGTHIYVDMPGKRNNISIDCGIEIKSNNGQSKLGNYIFLTNTHADHIAALFCSIINSRRFGATYTIYVPSSPDKSIAKKFIAMCEAFGKVGNEIFDVDEKEGQWRFAFLKYNIILKEAVGDMVVSLNNIVVRAVQSSHDVEACAYIVYTMAGGITKIANTKSPNITVGDFVFSPLATFGGETMVDLWKNNPHACQSKNVFVACLRYTGEPEEAHKHKHTHISDLTSVDWTKCENLYLYNTSQREKIRDMDVALKMHLPIAFNIYQNT